MPSPEELAAVRAIRAQAPGVAGMVRMGGSPAAAGPVEPDPVQEALRVRRELLGERIQEQAMSEAEAEAEARRSEAETRRATARLEMEAARAKLAELTQPAAGGGGSQDILLAMIEMFKGDRAQAQSEVSELRQQLMATIQESNGRVIEALREAAGSRVEQPVAASLVQQIAELKDIRGALLQLTPTPDVQSTARSLDEAIAMHKLQEDHEYRMAELAHARQMEERRLTIEERRLQAEGEARMSAARSFESVAPTIVQAFASRVLGMPAPEGGAPPPAGPTQQANCPQCNAVMTFPQGATETICQQCGSRWDLRPAETTDQQQLPGPADEGGEPPGPDANGNGHDGRFQPPSMFFS